ncbi:hypothetical protein SFC65_20380 [Priestia filamentosa]|uniref:hypothetical protein n=1 Tax=Priestia filamentosa TaxID=1402861 RepID=UPI003982541C
MSQLSPLEILEENIFNCNKLVSYLEIALFLEDDIAIEPGYVQYVDYKDQYFNFINNFQSLSMT